MTTTETVSVSLRSTLAAQLRDTAAARRKTLAAVVTEALESHLQPHQTGAEKLPEQVENILALAAATYTKQDEILAALRGADESELRRLQAINDNVKALSAALGNGGKNANRT